MASSLAGTITGGCHMGQRTVRNRGKARRETIKGSAPAEQEMCPCVTEPGAPSLALSMAIDTGTYPLYPLCADIFVDEAEI
jgi:hypothetical protein